jgi:hypothetical protein
MAGQKMSAHLELDVNLIATRVKADAGAVAKLAGSSEEFRSLCEDYILAVETLRRLEAPHRLEDHPKVVEYQRIVGELEGEIAGALAAKGVGT